ncbi:MAG: hypothetical protein IKP66_04830, partial [Lachnospiraceae bacterium]|nr:hypothetical protein [Lachnospiraceae bacterium]
SINLFNNLGNLYFNYWHEWNDIWDPSKEVTAPIAGVSASGNPVYPVLNGTYNGVEYHGNPETDTLGGEAVFNGRLSGLWDAITEFVPSAVEDMYNKMRQAGLRYDTMYAEYQKMRNYWCEALYNVDSMKRYVNTGSANCDRAYGDKLLLSKYFYKYRERYMDSKFKILDDKKYIPVRLSNVPEGVSEWGIWMKHYTPMYASFSWSSESVSTARSIDGNSVYLKGPASTSANEDAHINDADTVTEIGFYTKESGVYVEHGFETMQGFWFAGNFDVFKRLKKFIWANPSAKENTLQTANFNFDKLKLLEELVMTYCNKYEQDVVIGSNIIRKIDFSGTSIKSITIPETDTLTELHLPDSIKNLTLKNVPNLSTFTIDGISNLETVNIENAGTTVYNSIVEALVTAITNGEDVSLQEGRLTLTDITYETYQRLVNKYGTDVFNPSNDLYFEVPNKIFLSYDKVSLDAAGNLGGEHATATAAVLPPTAASTLRYQVRPAEIASTDGDIITTTNGSTLNTLTGEVVSGGSTDNLHVTAVVTVNGTEVSSDEIEIAVVVKEYPTLTISGKDYIRMSNKDYSYTYSADGGNAGKPISVVWSFEGGGGYITKTEVVTNGVRKAVLRASAVTSGATTGTLTVTLTYKTHYVSAQKIVTLQELAGAVDLGLSVLWASGNIVKDSEGNYSIGASTAAGCFFTRGNIVGYNSSEIGTGEGQHSFTQEDYATTPAANGPFSDAARELLGENGQPSEEWRLPSITEIQELVRDCTWTYENNGWKVTSKKADNNNYIFIPLSDNYNGTSGVGSIYNPRCYRNSHINGNVSNTLQIRQQDHLADGLLSKYVGAPIRPVASI